MSMEGEFSWHFWDLTIKPWSCYKGRYCWSCHEPKWPGYEPVNRPVNDKWVNLNSRGRLMVWEKDAANYGVTVISNNVTVATLNNGGSATYSHNTDGYSRTSFTNIHIQSSGLDTLKFYLWGTPTVAHYTTLEPLREQISYNEILFWPIHNWILVRQKDEEYWDMFGFDKFFVTNATSATLAAMNIENVASGRIVLGG